MNFNNPLDPNATIEEKAQYYHDECWKLFGALADKCEEVRDLKAALAAQEGRS